MLYRFFGLPAVNIILTEMTPRMFRSCLDTYSKDAYMLTVLKMQFEELEKVLTSIPNEYINPLDKRAYARLRRLELENPSDPQIEVYKKELKGKPMDIADFVLVDGMRKPISPVSKAIILRLKQSLNTIINYKNLISVNYNTEKEQNYFGYNLYHLRAVTEGSLMYTVSKFLKKFEERNGIGVEFWKEVDRFVSAVNSHCDDSNENVYNLSEPVIEEVRLFIENFDHNSLNGILGIDATLEDYYNTSLELHDIGMTGFTPFVKEMFKEFLNNYSPSYSSEIKIGSDSILYKFSKELERALNSHLNLGDPLVTVSNTDEEIEIEL